MEKTIKELADLIEANPKCIFVIDNDDWWITDTSGDKIADSSDYESGEWYDGSGNYGCTLADAMMELLNRKGFNLTQTAC